jgi:hypothetical protein
MDRSSSAALADVVLVIKSSLDAVGADIGRPAPVLRPPPLLAVISKALDDEAGSGRSPLADVDIMSL